MAKSLAFDKHAAQGDMRNVAIADLKPWPQNYRTHPEAQLLRLDESLRRYGQRSAVVVQASTMRIVAHHAVVQSAGRLGWETVRCDVWECTDDEAAAYLVDDNSLQRFAEDDEAALAGLLVSLQEVDAAPVSYNEDELHELLEQSMTPGPFSQDEKQAQAEEGSGTLHKCPQCEHEWRE